MPGRATPGFSGDRLKEAREARGLTAASLAELAGVSRQVVSQYEHGRTAPTPDTLYTLAGQLRLPVEFFVRPPRPHEDSIVFFRSQAAATKTERIKAERRLAWLEDLAEHIAEHVRMPDVDFPELGASDHAGWLPDDIESAAEEVRRIWAVGEGPITNVLGTIEKHGGLASRGILETQRIDAFSVVRGPASRPAFFFGSDKDSAARSRFDAAHELAHIVLHKAVTQKDLRSPSTRKQAEADAHRFASAFLLPAKEFLSDLRALTLDAMRIAKERWVVSIGAMIQRCEQLEVLDEREAKRLWIIRAKRGWSRLEPLDADIPPEEPRVLRDAVQLLVTEGGWPRDRIARDIRLDPSDVESLATLPAGYLAGYEPPVRLATRVRSVEPVMESGLPTGVVEFPRRPEPAE